MKTTNFHLWRERTLIAGGVISGLAAYGSFVVAAFTPISLAIALGAGSGVALSYMWKNFLGIMGRRRSCSLSDTIIHSPSSVFGQQASKLSKAAGLSYVPEIASVSVSKSLELMSGSLSFDRAALRWQQKVCKSHISNWNSTYLRIWGASFTTRRIYVPDPALLEQPPYFQVKQTPVWNQNLSEAMLAHETAHLVHDYFSPILAAKYLFAASTTALGGGLAIAAVAGSFLPVSVIGAGSALAAAGMLAVGHVAGSMGVRYAMRVCEARADRIGAELTGKPDQFILALAVFEHTSASIGARDLRDLGYSFDLCQGLYTARPQSLFWSLGKKHPSTQHRIRALQAHFGQEACRISPKDDGPRYRLSP